MGLIWAAYDRLRNRENRSEQRPAEHDHLAHSTTAVTPQPFLKRSVEKWIGERFIFLPQPKDFQEFGYTMIYKNRDRFGDGLPYERYASKIAIVKSIARSNTSIDDSYDVDMILESNSEEVFTTALSGQIDGLGFLPDIQDARKLYLDKTLWTEEQIKNWEVFDRTGKESSLSTPLGRFPVKVVDVVPGWENSCPVRFIVETPSREKGFIDVYMSETNISSPMEFQSFDNVFTHEYM